MKDDLSYYLALWRTPGIGPATFFKTLKLFPHLPDAFQSHLASPDWAGVERDLAWADGAKNRHIITWLDDAYPPLLREITSAPPLLFVEGDPHILSTPQLAMVGSRHPTESGVDLAEKFARYFAEAGLTVTSGMALGVDAASHQGALAVSGLTIAVTGTGLDQVYPAKHKKLAQEISEQGAIVSEFPIGVGIQPKNFPQRNRLISGLSMGVLVVEAAVGSGSLITAKYANEQGREVFAIPGSIHNPLARGCHALIRQGAKLVETASDVVEELGGMLSLIDLPPIEIPPNPPFSKGGIEKGTKGEIKEKHPDPQFHILLDVLESSPSPLDILIERTGLTAESVSSMLLNLELQGWVKRTSGGYMRINHRGTQSC